jgi:Cys-tRNA(Pro)/Cys-tRNA(Cys) deacylase
VARRNSDGAGSAGGGGATPATRVLAAAGVDYRAHAFAPDDRSRTPAKRQTRESFGTEAAEALGVEPERVFKTLVAEIDGGLWVAVIPVSSQLDLKALASAAGGKRATMADPAQAERSSGYVVGGISPLGQRKQLPTVIDSSALEHPSMFVSGGRRGLDLELAAADLVRVTSARTARIARPSLGGSCQSDTGPLAREAGSAPVRATGPTAAGPTSPAVPPR